MLIDEFSMVGRTKLAKASHNLNRIFFKLLSDQVDEPLNVTHETAFPYGLVGLM